MFQNTNTPHHSLKSRHQTFTPPNMAHNYSLTNQQFNRNRHSANMEASNLISSNQNNHQDQQQLLKSLLSSNSINLGNSSISTNSDNNIVSPNENSALLSSNDSSYLWKQYELAAAARLQQPNLNQNPQNDLTANLNSLSLALYFLLAGQDPTLLLNTSLPNGINNANLTNTTNTNNYHQTNSDILLSDDNHLNSHHSPISITTPNPFKSQQPTVPSSKILGKLHSVTSRPNAHILASVLDHTMIDLLETLYPINDNPDPAAIEMIAKRMNVNVDLVSDWFDNKRGPHAGPKSPTPKKRAGGRVVTFSEYQRSLLEAIFDENNYLHPNEYDELSNLVQVPSRNIKIWFKNRRSKKRLNLNR